MRKHVVAILSISILAVLGAAARPRPAAGRTWTIRMTGRDSTFRFEPAGITIAPGDSVRWIMTSGGPHNVAFDTLPLAPAARRTMKRQMPPSKRMLSGPVLRDQDSVFAMSFSGVPAGLYLYRCLPHEQFGMLGIVIVRGRSD